jgi:hypothetical protein
VSQVAGLTAEEVQQALQHLAGLSNARRAEALVSENSFKAFLIANDLAWLWDKLAAVAGTVWEFIKDLWDSM